MICQEKCLEHKGKVSRIDLWAGLALLGTFEFCEEAIVQKEKQGYIVMNAFYRPKNSISISCGCGNDEWMYFTIFSNSCDDCCSTTIIRCDKCDNEIERV